MILVLALTTLALVTNVQNTSADPPKRTPRISKQQQVLERLSPKLGEEFKIKSVSGSEVTVSIVERGGKHYIRSEYHRGWKSERREYAVPHSIASVSTCDRAINIFFSTKPGEKLVGAVYVINNHGEAVKVDDVTVVDVTW